jgi:hypothetical protein
MKLAIIFAKYFYLNELWPLEPKVGLRWSQILIPLI